LADQKLLGENYIHILGNERWHQWDWRNKHWRATRIYIVGYDKEDAEHMDDFDIRQMANLIGKSLSDGRFQYYKKA
jgi:hypothetical protein